jgi:hypothetical protein
VNRRVEHDLRGVETRDRIPELGAALLTGGRRNDVFEANDRLSHYEVERYRLTGDRTHRPFLLGVPDAENPNVRRAGWNVPNRVLPVRAGRRELRGADDNHSRFLDRLPRDLIGNPSGDGRLLRGERRRRERSDEGKRET